MIARLLPPLAAGCLGLAAIACGGAPTADQRTISDPVPNVSLTERNSALADIEEVPPAEVGKTDRISDPVDSKPLSEVDPAPLDEAPPSSTSRLADDGTADAPPPAAAPAVAAPCPEDDDTCRIDRMGDVRIGWLKEGMPRQAVLDRLGEPEKTEPEWEEGATGEWVAEQSWPSAGISITFSAPTQGGSQTVRGITVSAPFAEKTDRGVGIGSTRAEVLSAYGDVLDPRANGTVAGSVYGGVFFYFDAEGRVTSIFAGPGAE